MLSNRAIGMGIMASLLVIAAVCVFNEQTGTRSSEIVTEDKPVDISKLRGTALLAAEAKQKDAEANLLKKGHDMASVDTMLDSFQTAPDKSFQTKLTDMAIPHDEWAMPPPDKNGNIPQQGDADISAPDTSMSGFLEGTEGILLQKDEEWQPSGQAGLSDTIKQVTDEETRDEDAHNGFSDDDDILSAGGISEETMLFQAPPTTAAEAHKIAAKDDSLKVTALPVKKTLIGFDEGNPYDEEHYSAPTDEFEGDGILSAVGIQDAASDETAMIGTIDPDDFDLSFKPEAAKKSKN